MIGIAPDSVHLIIPRHINGLSVTVYLTADALFAASSTRFERTMDVRSCAARALGAKKAVRFDHNTAYPGTDSAGSSARSQATDY